MDYTFEEQMVLHNVTLVHHHQQISIRIKEGKIAELLTDYSSTDLETSLNFEDAIIFPGLINSHEHLDFNLFPQLGEQIYGNYQEWGKLIHQNYAKEIAQTLQVPKPLRERWGIYKNLICGVTTVINHGPKISPFDSYIKVLETMQSLHSVHFERYWKIKLNNPFKRKDIAIHVGEGTDESAKKEIDTLIQWNLLGRSLIGIHGVALSAKQANAFKALIWCPQSNYFLLNATADLHRIKSEIPILFGTDSTLTSNWDIWDHLNFARSLKKLTDNELYCSLNLNPAKIWKQLSGQIHPGFDADLVIAKKKGNKDSLNAFFNVQPCDLLLVMCKGEILLFDECMKLQFKDFNAQSYQKIKVMESFKYVIGDINQLIDQIKHYQPTVKFPVEVIPAP